MNDMSSVIVPKSDQINADDLIAGPITITISEVNISPGTEQPVSIHFQNDGGKPWRPCKSMSRVLVQAWGPDAKAYAGRSLTLYRDPKVKWGGLEVGGIRISHMSHIENDLVMALTETRGKRSPHKVCRLKDAPQAASADEKVRTWADTFIRNVGRAPDADKLAAFVDGKSSLLDEMAGASPDVHQECMAAIAAKRASFAPATDAGDDDDDPFADTAATEETPSQEMLRKFREQIAAAKNDKGLAAVEQEWVNKHRIAYDDSAATEIDGLIAAKRRELHGEEGGK